MRCPDPADLYPRGPQPRQGRAGGRRPHPHPPQRRRGLHARLGRHPPQRHPQGPGRPADPLPSPRQHRHRRLRARHPLRRAQAPARHRQHVRVLQALRQAPAEPDDPRDHPEEGRGHQALQHRLWQRHLHRRALRDLAHRVPQLAPVLLAVRLRRHPGLRRAQPARGHRLSAHVGHHLPLLPAVHAHPRHRRGARRPGLRPAHQARRAGGGLGLAHLRLHALGLLGVRAPRHLADAGCLGPDAARLLPHPLARPDRRHLL